MDGYLHPAPSPAQSWSMPNVQPEIQHIPTMRVIDHRSKYNIEEAAIEVEVEVELTHELPPSTNAIIRVGRTPLRTILSYLRHHRTGLPVLGLLSAVIPQQAGRLEPSGVALVIEVIESNVPVRFIPIGNLTPAGKGPQFQHTRRPLEIFPYSSYERHQRFIEPPLVTPEIPFFEHIDTPASCISPESTLSTPPPSPRYEVGPAFPPSPPASRLALAPVKQESPSPAFGESVAPSWVLRRTGTLPEDDKRGPVRLSIKGDLMDVTHISHWSQVERETGRRLIHFERKQHGRALEISFRPIEIASGQSIESIDRELGGRRVVSCLYRSDNNTCYITSVDIIILLQFIAGPDQSGADAFGVDEKNRIRRNLETYKPLTLARGKAAGGFFHAIMDLGYPKPRNIEKDIKVFKWSTLADALHKVIAKYSAYVDCGIKSKERIARAKYRRSRKAGRANTRAAAKAAAARSGANTSKDVGEPSPPFNIVKRHSSATPSILLTPGTPLKLAHRGRRSPLPKVPKPQNTRKRSEPPEHYEHGEGRAVRQKIESGQPIIPKAMRSLPTRSMRSRSVSVETHAPQPRVFPAEQNAAAVLSQALEVADEEGEDYESDVDAEGDPDMDASNVQQVTSVPVVHDPYEHSRSGDHALSHYSTYSTIIPHHHPLSYASVFEGGYPQLQGSPIHEWVPIKLFDSSQSEDGVYLDDPHKYHVAL